MTARPGITVALAGAGLSVAANVPAAWQVQRDLLMEAAAASGDAPEDPFAWWLERTGAEARYDEVLYASANTPAARRHRLQPFFEPTDEQRAQGIKVPSAGHYALARLMRDGLIRIIVTLNFDLLIEAALRDLGIEPTIVSTAADVAGMEPLHAQTRLVWHLHGDYTRPEMLNTPDELRQYPAVVTERLAELFDQYGLLIVGWSAQYDQALVRSLAATPSRRYPTFWLDRAQLSDEAIRLARQRGAEIVTDDADSWLTRLQEACELVSSRTAEPLSVLATIAAVKRDLRSGNRPIDTHDRVQAEASRLRSLPAFSTEVSVFDSISYTERLAAVENDLELWAGLTSTLAYWGNPETDTWWTDHIFRFADLPIKSGETGSIYLLAAPAAIGFYAGGVAALAAGRLGLVGRLLAGGSVQDSRGIRAPASTYLTPQRVFANSAWPNRQLYELLSPILADVLGLGSDRTEESWERFEYLILLNAIDRGSQQLPRSYLGTPHTRVDDDFAGSSRATVPVPAAWFSEHSADIVTGLGNRLFMGKPERLLAAQEEAATEIAQSARRWESRLLARQGGHGYLPSGRRYAIGI